jgi:MFS family permease
VPSTFKTLISLLRLAEERRAVSLSMMSLSQDRRHRLGQWFRILQNPPPYVSASLIVSLGGLLNGLDTGTIGPVTTMPSFTDSFGVLSSTLNGLVVSSILLPATFSSLFAGAIADSLGRTRAVAIGALFFAIGAALEASAVNLGMLIGGRCVVGLGEGLFLSTLVV